MTQLQSIVRAIYETLNSVQTMQIIYTLKSRSTPLKEEMLVSPCCVSIINLRNWRNIITYYPPYKYKNKQYYFWRFSELAKLEFVILF